MQSSSAADKPGEGSASLEEDRLRNYQKGGKAERDRFDEEVNLSAMVGKGPPSLSDVSMLEDQIVRAKGRSPFSSFVNGKKGRLPRIEAYKRKGPPDR